jgi:hypothetical protein
MKQDLKPTVYVLKDLFELPQNNLDSNSSWIDIIVNLDWPWMQCNAQLAGERQVSLSDCDFVCMDMVFTLIFLVQEAKPFPLFFFYIYLLYLLIGNIIRAWLIGMHRQTSAANTNTNTNTVRQLHVVSTRGERG